MNQAKNFLNLNNSEDKLFNCLIENQRSRKKSFQKKTSERSKSHEDRLDAKYNSSLREIVTDRL